MSGASHLEETGMYASGAVCSPHLSSGRGDGIFKESFNGFSSEAVCGGSHVPSRPCTLEEQAVPFASVTAWSCPSSHGGGVEWIPSSSTSSLNCHLASELWGSSITNLASTSYINLASTLASYNSAHMNGSGWGGANQFAGAEAPSLQQSMFTTNAPAGMSPYMGGGGGDTSADLLESFDSSFKLDVQPAGSALTPLASFYGSHASSLGSISIEGGGRGRYGSDYDGNIGSGIPPPAADTY